MANNLYCKIIYGSKTEFHLSQILAGFQLLSNSKKLKFEIEFNPEYIKLNYIHIATIEVVLNRTYKIVYDLADGYQSFHDFPRFDKILDKVDYYFKRSTSNRFNKSLVNKDKIKPLGLNYRVSCRNNDFDKLINSGTDLFDRVKKYLEYLRYYKRFESEFFYRKFENSIDSAASDYKLLYNVRLYDSSTISLNGIKKAYTNLDDNTHDSIYNEWKNDLDTVTRQRIAIVRVLKETFGNQFEGGITRDAFSEKLVPDLLLPSDNSNKFNYLKKIKGNYVCISSVGLHQSIGWKFGEYVASSRAILTDSLQYDLPGNFKENTNYLVYNNSNELIDNAKNLIENPNLIHEIEKNNFEYYNHFVRPDKMISNTLHYLGFDI